MTLGLTVNCKIFQNFSGFRPFFDRGQITRDYSGVLFALFIYLHLSYILGPQVGFLFNILVAHKQLLEPLATRYQ